MRIILVIFLCQFICVNAQVPFEQYFEEQTLRFDYVHAGNNLESHIYFEQMKREPFWGGTKSKLIDRFEMGHYKFQVFDSTTNTLLFSRGYSSLFREWQDTEEAKTLNRSFYESIVFPFPKSKVRLVIQERDKSNKLTNVFETIIDPNNYQIIKSKNSKYKTTKLFYSGDHHKNIDIVMIPEGYTSSQMAKFHKDSKKFIDDFFKTQPFARNRGRFNFWSVDAASEDSGTDIPNKGVWKNTLLNSKFCTFNSDRYLTTLDVKSLRDVAAYVPYDQIYILVNTDNYGGGAIYNFYNLCVSDHVHAQKVFTHEFGHGFGSLADEYAYGTSNPEDMYDLSVEPYSPNISTLVDLDSKWGAMIDKNTPVPTPNIEKYKNKIGAFEGAGYSTKKLYRPVSDCKMRSNNVKEFCPVCIDHLQKMIDFTTE